MHVCIIFSTSSWLIHIQLRQRIRGLFFVRISQFLIWICLHLLIITLLVIFVLEKARKWRDYRYILISVACCPLWNAQNVSPRLAMLFMSLGTPVTFTADSAGVKHRPFIWFSFLHSKSRLFSLKQLFCNPRSSSYLDVFKTSTIQMPHIKNNDKVKPSRWKNDKVLIFFSENLILSKQNCSSRIFRQTNKKTTKYWPCAWDCNCANRSCNEAFVLELHVTRVTC